jgi:ketosteroid isomerase-like protein
MSNVDLIRGLYEAFGRGDIPTVLGAMDPDIEWRLPEGHPYQPSGTPWVGPDAVAENLFLKLGAEWDGFAVHAKEFRDAGDTVVMEGRGVCGTRGAARLRAPDDRPSARERFKATVPHPNARVEKFDAASQQRLVGAAGLRAQLGRARPERSRFAAGDADGVVAGVSLRHATSREARVQP